MSEPKLTLIEGPEPRLSECVVQGDNILLSLSAWERLRGIHSDILRSSAPLLAAFRSTDAEVTQEQVDAMTFALAKLQREWEP